MSEAGKVLNGLVAAPFTPFNADFSLNLEVIDGFSKYLGSVGVRGVFVCGTTGEFSSLTMSERLLIAEAWAKVARRDGLKLVLHVGDNCLTNACELAAHAASLPVDAISMVPPSYFKPGSVKEVVNIFGQVAHSAPSLPIYYYDIPGLTGVVIPTSEFVREARRQVPSFAGVKFSNLDLVELQRCIGLDDGNLNLLFGCDEMLMAAQSLGIDGAVGSTYNYLSPLYYRMLAAFEKGDLCEAQSLQRQSVDLVGLLNLVSPLSASKSLLKRIGFDFGPVRLPLRSLTPSEQKAFDESIDHLNLFQ
ncbi:dihydrodipicolinate synthase family protein [Verrucomicrobia bacterium]|jgi:N-acetylneuraminate lyase|nr:N-acetylneuraminate lyase [Verrucomicrobiota bacterium]MDA7657185.1 dihydrodipicolinate synthase family protein [Verrucomicrobiota bacterium]